MDISVISRENKYYLKQEGNCNSPTNSSEHHNTEAKYISMYLFFFLLINIYKNAIYLEYTFVFVCVCTHIHISYIYSY